MKRNCPIGILLFLSLSMISGCAGITAEDAVSEDEFKPVILVATQRVRGDHQRSVLYAKPVGNDMHIGFFVNRPTVVKLGQLFPNHKPSHKISEPVYFGGRMSNAIIAIVKASVSPGKGSIQLADNLFMAMMATTVDSIIEKGGNNARFFYGYILWEPGELHEQIRKGLWRIFDADTELVIRKETGGMWEELLIKIEAKDNEI